MDLIKNHQKQLVGFPVFLFRKCRVGKNSFLMWQDIPVKIQALSKLTLITLRQGCFSHLTRAADEGHFVELPDNRINQGDE